MRIEKDGWDGRGLKGRAKGCPSSASGNKEPIARDE